MFEQQRCVLDELASLLGLPVLGKDGTALEPFTGQQWQWQIPDNELIGDESAQPPRQLAWERQQGADAVAAADPRRQPETAAELRMAVTWNAGRDVPVPAFASPPSNSGLSWSEDPRPPGGQEASSRPAGGEESRGPGDGGESACAARAATCFDGLRAHAVQTASSHLLPS